MLLFRKGRLIHHLHRERVLICVVVQVDKAVIEKEARVAFLAIGIVDLLTTLYVLERLDDEALTLICVGPASLARTLVIEHIGVGYKAVSLHSLDLDTEDAAGDHHADFRVLLQRELLVVGDLVADSVIVLLDVTDFFANLLLERATFEPSALLLGVEDGEVIEGLG